MRRTLLAGLLVLCVACSAGEGSNTRGAVALVRGTEADYITHGDDPLPPRPLDASKTVREESWPCQGTGVDGNRVQLLYAHGAGQGNLAANRPNLEAYARRVEGAFAETSRSRGSYRTVRFVTTDSCLLVIDDIIVSDGALRSFDTFIQELEAKGYRQANRKYHAWVESSAYCGIGTVTADDRPGLNNAANTGPSYSRSDRPCWNYAEAHEILHNLGAVQLSAPNSTGAWHCRDEHDIECYADGGPKGQMFDACPDAANEDRLDCRGDDYFNSSPEPGLYLSTHWNVASSSFLAAGATPTSVLPTTTSSTSVPPTTVPPTTSTSIGKGETNTRISVPAKPVVGAGVLVSASVAGSCGPTGAVAFYVSGKLMGRQILDVNGTVEMVLRFASPGRVTVRAAYEGSSVCAKSQASTRPSIR